MSIEPPATVTEHQKWIQACNAVQASTRRRAMFTPKLQAAGAKYAIQSCDVDRPEGKDYGDSSHERFVIPAQPDEARKIGLLAPDAYDLQKGDLLGFIPNEEDAPLQLWSVVSSKNYEWNRGLHVEIRFVGLVER